MRDTLSRGKGGWWMGGGVWMVEWVEWVEWFIHSAKLVCGKDCRISIKDAIARDA